MCQTYTEMAYVGLKSMESWNGFRVGKDFKIS